MSKRSESRNNDGKVTQTNVTYDYGNGTGRTDHFRTVEAPNPVFNGPVAREKTGTSYHIGEKTVYRKS